MKGKKAEFGDNGFLEGRRLAKSHFGEAESPRADQKEPDLLSFLEEEVVLPCSPLRAFGQDGSVRAAWVEVGKAESW